MTGLFKRRRWIPATRLIVPAVIDLAMTGFVVIQSFVAEPIPTLAGLTTAPCILLAGFFLTRTLIS